MAQCTYFYGLDGQRLFFSPRVDTNIDRRASYQQLDPEAFVRANTVTAALRAMTGASTPVTVS